MSDTILQFRGTIYEQGYGQVAKVVMRDQELSKTAKLVYAYICTFGSNAFPGRSTICSDLGIGKTTLSDSLRNLTDNGYLTIEQQRNSNGYFARNVYYIEPVKK